MHTSMGIILRMDDSNNIYISLVFLAWSRKRTMKLVSEIREIIPVWDFNPNQGEFNFVVLLRHRVTFWLEAWLVSLDSQTFNSQVNQKFVYFTHEQKLSRVQMSNLMIFLFSGEILLARICQPHYNVIFIPLGINSLPSI